MQNCVLLRMRVKLFPRCADGLHAECSAAEIERVFIYDTDVVDEIKIETCPCECHVTGSVR